LWLLPVKTINLGWGGGGGNLSAILFQQASYYNIESREKKKLSS